LWAPAPRARTSLGLGTFHVGMHTVKTFNKRSRKTFVNGKKFYEIYEQTFTEKIQKLLNKKFGRKICLSKNSSKNIRTKISEKIFSGKK
jgi:hypothetical protein